MMIAISRDPCDVTLSARSQVLSIISKRLVRKSLDMFADIQKDEEKYTTFLQNFGRYLKVGLIEDKDNKDALLKLASFASSGSTERGTTLPEYKERMKEGQKQIYYVSGTSKVRPPPSDCPPMAGGSPTPTYHLGLCHVAPPISDCGHTLPRAIPTAAPLRNGRVDFQP